MTLKNENVFLKEDFIQEFRNFYNYMQALQPKNGSIVIKFSNKGYFNDSLDIFFKRTIQ